MMTPDDLKALEAALPAMTDREILTGMETAPLESEKFELFVGEAERRNLDS